MKQTLRVLIALSLGGCSASPASLGITGPAPPPPPPTVDDSTIMNPGIPDPGTWVGPSFGPSPTAGPFYNYN
jgi:hypothetical protein